MVKGLEMIPTLGCLSISQDSISVFKYLMDDNRVAKLIVSALLAEEVEELEFRPAEVRAEVRS